ncbi:MAG: C25 family cysteine peptidase [candidate division WOR-3 bacterium]
MYLVLIIFLKTGIFLINDNIRDKIKIYREGYFGPYRIAIGESNFNFEKNLTNSKNLDFYGNILKKLALNPSYIEEFKNVNLTSFLETDTPLNLPKNLVLIYTKDEGLYSIKGYMLSSKGINLDTVNPNYITILGKEGKLPIITKGLNDGKFDPFDEIIFYAKKLSGKNSFYDLYSFENIYILFFNRNPKVEIPEEDAKPDNDTSYINSGFFKFHFEEERYFPDLDPAHSDTEDIWFFRYLTKLKEETLKIKIPLAIDSNLYKLRLNFDSEETQSIDWIHKIYLKIGKYFIDSFIYNSRNPYTIEVNVKGFILNSDSLFFIWEKSDIPNYLNYIEIEGEFLLNSNKLDNLKFELKNINKNIVIKGFKNKPLFFININKKNYKNFEIISYIENGKTYYGLKAKIDENLPSLFFVTDKTLSPDSIILYRIEKDVRKVSGANAIILYHPEFKEFADSLVLFHSSPKGGNYNIKAFSVKDIYVQFNYGIKSPFAIRKFLKYFYITKEPKFNYLIIIGDASKDPRDILKGIMKDKVPTFLFPSTFQQFQSNAIFTGFFSSDFYYSNIIGDDPFPDIVVSRIPVQNKIEMKIVLRKIKDYADKNLGIWRRHFILATERKTGQGSDIYTQINNFLKSLMKKGMTYVEPDENETPENLINYLSDGASIFNFIGHGGIHTLWVKGAFRQEDLWETTNYKKCYFFTALSCWTGEFGMTDARAFGEEILLLPERGAIGSISLSGSGKEPGNLNFDISSDYTKSIFIGYLRNSINKIGDLVLYSRMYLLSRFSILDKFVETTLKTSNLLGDPLLDLPELEEVNVKSDKNYYNPLDSALIYVQNPQIVSGSSAWEIIYKNLKDKIILRELYTKAFDNGEIKIKFQIPQTITRAKAEIYLYAFGLNPFKEIISKGNLSVKILNVDSIYFKPDIYSEDTFRVYAKLSASYPLKSCELWYSMNDTLNPQNLIRVTMSRTSRNTFKTNITLPPFDRKYFHYAFIATDTFFNSYFSDTLYLKNKTLADLVLKKNLINITPSLKFPEINFPFTNSGGRDANNFYIFYIIKTGSFLKKDSVFINTFKSQETQLLKIPLPCSTYYSYKIILDYKNSVKEISEFNNSDSGIIRNPYIYVDTSGFKGKINFKNLKFNMEFYPSNNLSIYELKKLKNTSIEDSTIKIIGIKENNKEDTIGKFIFENINEKKDVIIKIDKDSLWHKIDYVYDSLNNKIEFYLNQKGEIALFNTNDNKGPLIEVYYKNRKIEEEKFMISKNLDLKILLRDSSGIDLIFKKPEIIFNNSKINYENSMIKKEKGVIINLKEGPLKEGIYPLKLLVFDAMGNKSEKDFLVEVFVPFDILYYGNYPNPAKEGKTVIFYELTKEAEKMEIKIYTVSGRLIKEFITDDEGSPLNLKGKHKVTWNLRDFYGNKVSKGIYFLLLKGKRGKENKKIKAKIAVGE